MIELRKGERRDVVGNILALTNNGDVAFYGYDAVGQLTNEVTATVTNAWQYDEAGDWIKSPAENWRMYDSDNELVGVSPNSSSSVMVTGAAAQSNRWPYLVAECRGVSVPVSTNDGTFSLAEVPLYPGSNALEPCMNGNQQHGKCHLFLKRRRQQLLGVHGLAALAGASSHVFIRTPQHTGHPHPVLSSSTSGMHRWSPKLPCQPSQERDRFRLCRVEDWRKAAVVARSKIELSRAAASALANSFSCDAPLA